MSCVTKVRAAAIGALESAAFHPSFRERILRGSAALRAWSGHIVDSLATAAVGNDDETSGGRLWHKDASIHPTATVDPTAAIDSGAVIGAMSVVGPGALIGADVVVGSHVVIPSKTAVGNASTVHPFACVGGDPQDKKYAGEPTWLLLGARSVVREHATLSRGTGLGGGVTRIGDGCLIMSGVHVAHDCVLGAGVVLSSGASLAGHVAVGDGAIIGGHAGVLQRVCVGAHAMVGGMSAVRADVLPFSLVQGNPAATLGLNVVGLRRAGAHNHTIWLLRAALRFCLAGADGGGASQQLHGGARDQAQAPGWTWQSTVSGRAEEVRAWLRPGRLGHGRRCAGANNLSELSEDARWRLAALVDFLAGERERGGRPGGGVCPYVAVRASAAEEARDAWETEEELSPGSIPHRVHQ